MGHVVEEHASTEGRDGHSGAEESVALEKATEPWAGEVGPERDDPAHVLVWGRSRALADLDPARFSALAARVWAPLLAVETVDRP